MVTIQELFDLSHTQAAEYLHRIIQTGRTIVHTGQNMAVQINKQVVLPFLRPGAGIIISCFGPAYATALKARAA